MKRTDNNTRIELPLAVVALHVITTAVVLAAAAVLLAAVFATDEVADVVTFVAGLTLGGVTIGTFAYTKRKSAQAAEADRAAAADQAAGTDTSASVAQAPDTGRAQAARASADPTPALATTPLVFASAVPVADGGAALGDASSRATDPEDTRSGSADLAAARSDGTDLVGAHADAKDSGGDGAEAELALTAEPTKYSKLDLQSLSKRLVGCPDPVAELKLMEKDIADRERAWTGHGRWSHGRAESERARLVAHALGHEETTEDDSPDPDPEVTPIPSGAELFLAHRLRASGLYDEDVEMPRMHIVCPHSSGMFYLRVEQDQVPYGTMLVVLRIEAALNAVRFALRYYDDREPSEDDCISLVQRISSSIVAQAAPIDEPVKQDQGIDPDGAWAVRHAISQAIESFQLPYRLVANFRSNVADGNVAIEVQLTPGDVFPEECISREMGDHRIPATRQMRRMRASDYALRLAILLAASAFRASGRIKHVWVAGILETATRRDCYYSIDFDRWRFAKVDLEEVDDLERVLHPFCPAIRLEDGFLRPVAQTFSLGEERFCPRRRFESVSLSSRRLKGAVAEALGTDHVSGLAVDEGEKRVAVADDILRHLALPNDERATEHDVHAILEIAGDDPDPSVRSAAERTARALVAGSISDDPLAVVDEFVSGDDLTRAVRAAHQALAQHDFDRAAAMLSAVLSPIDEAGYYDDTDHMVWRYFADYTARALFNRIGDLGGRSLMLVPRSYFDAHLLMTVALLASNRFEDAERHARLLVRIAPLDTRSRLQLVRTLEAQNRDDEAIAELRALLEIAHDPQSVGTAYYRMAYFQWKTGNIIAAQACYALAVRFLPAAVQTISLEVATLAMSTGDIQGFDHELSEREVMDALAAHDIPEAPTDRVSEAFFQCAHAALDAEIFPVARNFMTTLAAFAPDDVIVGILRSLEDAPDSRL